MDDNWQDNPKLAGIDKNKLDMIQQMARQGAGKSPSDLLPFIMNAASQGRNAGLNFNSNEINTIIEVLKMGKSPRERAKLDKVKHFLRLRKLTPQLLPSCTREAAPVHWQQPADGSWFCFR